MSWCGRTDVSKLSSGKTWTSRMEDAVCRDELAQQCFLVAMMKWPGHLRMQMRMRPGGYEGYLPV